MERRKAIKGIFLFSLGTGLIYSCTDPYQAVRDLNLDFLSPEDTQLSIIDNISSIILPIRSIPELANHTILPFIMKMVDDNYNPRLIQDFITGYRTWDNEVSKLGTTTFLKMKDDEKANLLARFNENDKELPKVLQYFYNVIKKESIKYLTTSEYYQRKVNYYEMAPGRFRGDIDLSDLQNRNAS